MNKDHIQIRKGALSDIDAVAKLSAQLGYVTTLAATETRLKAVLASNTHVIFVAIKENVVVGWISAFVALQLSSDAYTEINGLVVDEQLRGQGIGKKLVRIVEHWSQEKGMLNIRVRSRVKRLEAHKFYELLGFQETKSQKVFKKSLP